MMEGAWKEEGEEGTCNLMEARKELRTEKEKKGREGGRMKECEGRKKRAGRIREGGRNFLLQ